MSSVANTATIYQRISGYLRYLRYLRYRYCSTCTSSSTVMEPACRSKSRTAVFA